MSANSLVPDVTTTVKKPKVEKPNAQELPVQKDALADSLTDSLSDTLVDPLDVQLSGSPSETAADDDGAGAAPGHDPSEQPEGSWGYDRTHHHPSSARESKDRDSADQGDDKSAKEPTPHEAGDAARTGRT